MRKSISVRFFSIVCTLMVLGVAIMGGSQLVLFRQYYAGERYKTLDDVGEVALRTFGYVARTLDEEHKQDILSSMALVQQTADVSLFFVGTDGALVLYSGPAVANAGACVPAQVLQQCAGSGAQQPCHLVSDLDGLLAEQCFISARALGGDGQPAGYLFVCSSSQLMEQFTSSFVSNFLLSACLMLLCASVMTMVLMRSITGPLHRIGDAAQKFGGGDFSVRVGRMEGDNEIAYLAATFDTMAANLQAIDNSRAQFMGNIAHELRTPMTTIKGFIDGILDGTIPPELQNHYLQLVSQETGRLARLVQNMLDLSKLESGEYQVNARMFNVWETITGVALSAEQRINDGGIELEGLTMDKLLAYADPDLIHQVMYNLLDNAIKFTPRGGVIRFGAEKLGPEVEISIWNSGQGISAEALPFVFERFYKEDQSRGLNARGAGLGLNICKVLVTLSGGQIRVESQEGEWCRFVFTLPAQAPNQQSMLRIPDETGAAAAIEEPDVRPVR